MISVIMIGVINWRGYALKLFVLLRAVICCDRGENKLKTVAGRVATFFAEFDEKYPNCKVDGGTIFDWSR